METKVARGIWHNTRQCLVWASFLRSRSSPPGQISTKQSETEHNCR